MLAHRHQRVTKLRGRIRRIASGFVAMAPAGLSGRRHLCFPLSRLCRQPRHGTGHGPRYSWRPGLRTGWRGAHRGGRWCGKARLANGSRATVVGAPRLARIVWDLANVRARGLLRRHSIIFHLDTRLSDGCARDHARTDVGAGICIFWRVAATCGESGRQHGCHSQETARTAAERLRAAL